jgi:WD40 repeat protein
MGSPDTRRHAAIDASTAAGETYLYDVFISYRLVDPDRTVGIALQRLLEGFRTPRALVKAGVPQRLKRVFRDRSELAASSDLEAELVDALRRSRFLLVVCSTRTPESKWIAREVEVFRQLGGGKRVLLLLIDGEPASAYPPALSHEAAGADLLAADVRAPTLRQSLRLLRTTEKLRLLAPILGVKFDDLWQRERRRRRQRMVALGTLSAVVIAAVSGLAWLSSTQARSRQLTAAIATLSDNSLRLSDEGRTGLAAQLALQAHRFDPDGRLGMQSRVYAALRRSLGSGPFNQIVSETDAAPNSVAVSADGRMLVVGRSDGSIEVFDLSRGAAPVATTRFQGVGIKAVAFLGDDRRFAVGRDDGEVWLVAIDGSALKPSLLGDCGTVEALAASSSGRIVAAGTEEDGVCLLDPGRPGVVAHRLVTGIIRALAFSADGKWLAAGRKGGVELWAADADAVSAKSVALSLEDETVTALAFSATQLAAGSHTDFGARLTEAFRRRDFSGGDQTLQGVLRIWRTTELGRSPRALPAETQRVLGIAFSRDGETLASGGVDGKIRLWTVADPAGPARHLVGHEGNVVSLAFAEGDGMLVSAGTDRSVRAWRLVGPRDSALATDGAVLSLDFPGKDHLAAAEKLGQTPLVWDLRKAPPVRVRTPEVRGVTTSIAADGAKPGRFAFGTGLLIGSAPDLSVRVWDLAEGRFPMEPVAAHKSDVDALAFGVAGRWLASAGYLDKNLKVLDRQSGQVREIRLPDELGAIHAVAFHPSAEPPVLAVGGDGHLAILDLASGRPTLVPHAFEGSPTGAWRVADLDFSPDGALLATTAPDGKVRLWRVGEWVRPHAVLEPAWAAGPVGVRQLAFNRVGGELAVGYQDGAIRIWAPHAPQRPPVLVHPAGGGAVQSLAFDPAGTALAAGFANGGIEILSTLQSLVAAGCAGLFNNLSEAEWATFVGPKLAYAKTCPGLLTPGQQER